MHTYYRIKKIQLTHIQQEHDKGRKETKVMQGMQIKCWQMEKKTNIINDVGNSNMVTVNGLPLVGFMLPFLQLP